MTRAIGLYERVVVHAEDIDVDLVGKSRDVFLVGVRAQLLGCRVTWKEVDVGQVTRSGRPDLVHGLSQRGEIPGSRFIAQQIAPDRRRIRQLLRPQAAHGDQAFQVVLLQQLDLLLDLVRRGGLEAADGHREIRLDEFAVSIVRYRRVYPEADSKSVLLEPHRFCGRGARHRSQRKAGDSHPHGCSQKTRHARYLPLWEKHGVMRAC